MGNDGGTIARGQDLKAVYAKPGDVLRTQNATKIDNLQRSLLSVCALSSLPLFEHGTGQAVVSDFQGKLYLKEKMLELILSKKSSASKRLPGGKVPHINGLADILDVRITWSPEGDVTCPITKSTKTLKTTFAYFRPCGCVLSSRLVQDIQAYRKVAELDPDAGISDTCPNCSTPFTFNYDLVMLNPQNEASLEKHNLRNYAYLKDELGLSHSKKPLKKEKRPKRQTGANGSGKRGSIKKVQKP